MNFIDTVQSSRLGTRSSASPQPSQRVVSALRRFDALQPTCLALVYEWCGSAASCSSDTGAPCPGVLLRSSASSICSTVHSEHHAKRLQCANKQAGRLHARLPPLHLVQRSMLMAAGDDTHQGACIILLTS